MSRLTSHYETIRDRFELDEIDAETEPSWLQPLRHRFVAADGADLLDSALDRPTLVAMGAGMTGPPHLGTVGQLVTAIELQEAGLDVQFALADLEPYHDGGDADRIERLAERYRAFALDLGFDPERGTLRTQSEATEVMATGHRIARYYRSDGWDENDDLPATEWEQAVEGAYDADAETAPDESDGTTSDAADSHSSVLHGADFLHPLREDDYEQLLLVFGADEHGLLPWARSFREAADVSGRIGGLFTRMVPGFDGTPKQSKSIDAGQSLADDPTSVRERIVSERGSGDPATSAVFQSMCLASRYDAERLDEVARACESGGSAWDEARHEYAEYVAGLVERWRATGR